MTKSSMSLFGNVICPCTRSSHSVLPSGTRKRSTNASPIGHAVLTLVRREAIASAIVLERVAARLGLGSALLELRRRAEAAVDGASVEQPLRVRLVSREIRALVRDLLVPGEAEPLESLEDRARAFVGAAGAIGVLDAEQERSAVLAREEPVVERRARTADVEIASR